MLMLWNFLLFFPRDWCTAFQTSQYLLAVIVFLNRIVANFELLNFSDFCIYSFCHIMTFIYNG